MAKKSKVGLKVPTANEMAKKYGSMIKLASEVTDTDLYIPSTFFALNYLFGKGIPYGKIVEIAGEESSGKSLVAYNFAYATQQLGGHVIWVDAEQSWMNSWAEINGVDPARVTIVNDTRIEYIADVVADLAIYLRSQLTHNEPILLVIDSIAATDCTDNIDAKMVDGKAEMGGRAKALYKYFRIRSELFYKLGVSQIYINQLRTALNVGFGKITQQLQEVQHLSSTLQSELLSIQEGLLPLNKMGKKGKLGNLSLSDLLKIKLRLLDLQSANALYISILNSTKSGLIDAML